MSAAITTQREGWAPNMVKSMRLFQSVIEQQQGVTVIDPRAGVVSPCPHLVAVLLLKGDSGRTYRLSIRDVDGSGLQCGFTVEGARWRQDLLRPYASGAAVASLCLQSAQPELPAGDHAVSLALSLLRDRQTAMRIPLLGQFISADRAILKDIGMFTEEGPMPDFEDPMDFFEDPHEETEAEDPFEWTELDELLHAPPPREESTTTAEEHDAPLIREEVFLRAIEEAEQVGLERIAEAFRAML
ncbi:MAG: hypothetical protein CMB11_01020 [Euryarchaeota archaeon]|nr:hypothetical protein [Euryarchaeota archaeon]